METTSKRIVSLLPSTTEIVAALGLKDQLVGRSHACDFPPGVVSLPTCTQPKFNPDGQSYQIDQRVKALLQEGLSVYRVNAEKLTELNPDFIITQDHCEVCAVSVNDVKMATQAYLNHAVEIISVSPTTLAEVYDSIRQIAEALNVAKAGQTLTQSMQDDFSTIGETTVKQPAKQLLNIEWLDPLMTAGNWVPELADIANLKTELAETGAHSPWVEWNDIQALDPEIICVMPCGYSIDQTLNEMHLLTQRNGWTNLQAVADKQVFIADGHHYFNRPGPRLTDSARIFAEILHPTAVSSYRNRGWINFFDQ